MSTQSIKQNMYRVKDLNLFVCFSLMFTGLSNHLTQESITCLTLLTVYRLMNKNIYSIKIFLFNEKVTPIKKAMFINNTAESLMSMILSEPPIN